MPSRSELAELPPAGHEPGTMRCSTDEPAARCASLWQSVILQAVLDASRSATHRENGSVRSGEALRARRWLADPSRGRATAFELAGIDLQAFVTRGLPHLQAAWAQVDAAPPREQRRWTPEQNAARAAAMNRRARERRPSYA